MIQKPLRIKLDKIDGFIRIYDGIRYLTLFGCEKYDAIYNKIRYKSTKWHHIYFFSLFCKNQSWFLWFLSYRKILTLHNVIILIKSVLNKNKSHYYYKTFLEKCSYQLAEK